MAAHWRARDLAIMAGGGAPCPEGKPLKATDQSLGWCYPPAAGSVVRLTAVASQNLEHHMTNLTRRGFTARAGATLALATTAALSSPAAADDIDVLYRAYIDLLPEHRRLRAAYGEAEARMPEWARPGPSCIDRDGKFVGSLCGAPRDETIKPSPFGALLCRPTRHDLRRTARAALGCPPGRCILYNGEPVTPANARAWYVGQLRSLREREAAAQVETDRAGVQAADAACNEHFDKVFDARMLVEAAPLSFNSVAARLLIVESVGLGRETYADALSFSTLEHLRPHLTGLIREHVDHLLAAIEQYPTVKLADMPFDA